MEPFCRLETQENNRNSYALLRLRHLIQNLPDLLG